MCSLSPRKKKNLPLLPLGDKTEDALLARSAHEHPVTGTVTAALKCDKACLLFSFTKITVLHLLLKIYEKKKKKHSPLFNLFICLNLMQMTEVIT